MKFRVGCVVIGLLSLVLSLGQLTFAQTPAQTASALPHLVRFSGTVKDVNGNPLTGVVGVTFALYSEQTGGTALWLETQNVAADSSGRYSVLLGSTKAAGLPDDLFTSEQAHWVGVQVSGQAEQPRVLLVSAPYALKAGDAETIGGLPPSAFVLAAPSANTATNGINAGTGPEAGTTAAVGGSGTADFVPLWTAGSILGNSVLFQSGSGNTATVGINTTTPAATLDVNGNVISRGALQLPSKGTATAGGGFNSQPFSLQGSAFNSSSNSAIGPLFQWQTEPTGNNTTNAAGTLNLLYGTGSGSPSETGLNIANNGKITFATGQTFPGAGTITGVTTASGSGLTGGGTSGSLNLSLTNTCAANQVLQWSGSAWACATISGGGGGGTITGVTAGTDLTGGGTSGTVTLNLDTTKVPQLATANTFTGNQSITGNLAATGTVSGAAATFTGVVTEAGALLPAIGTATASQGFNSQPLDSVTSAYNSTAGSAQNWDFRWLAEPVGNNTSSPSGKLDLLFGANGASPTETGLSVASNGQITFATGQTFPGAGGSGTVTSVGSGLGLKGGPITTSGTLTIDTSVVPQLGAANTFSANQTLNATLFATSGSLAVQAGATSVNGVGINALSSATTGTGVGAIGATNSPAGNGVIGTNNAATGTTAGVLGQTSSTAGYGVVGLQGGATNTSLYPAGVYGASSSSIGFGVEGSGIFGVVGTSTEAGGIGVSGSTSWPNSAAVTGQTGSPSSDGVYGLVNAATGNAAGVYGQTQSSAGYGVDGTGPYIGVYGTTSSAGAGAGILGETTSGSGTNFAVWGLGESPAGYAVYGENYVTSGTTAGVYGITASATGYGVEGTGPAVGVYGTVSSATSGYGVEGQSPNVGVYGQAGSASVQAPGSCCAGLWGDGGNNTGVGVLGTSGNGAGGTFINNSTVSSIGSATISAANLTGYPGGLAFFAALPNALDGQATIGDAACGVSFMALQLGASIGSAMSGCDNYTLMGDTSGNTYLNAAVGGMVSLRVNNGDGVMNVTSGNVTVNGNFSVTGVKHFRIDHPLDPANKYLFHASIESSEVLNLYSGNVVLDGSGEAVVQLPDWFEVINKDFRYQLTPIGAPGRDLYVAEEVSGGHFKIAGGKPGGKVSWQVSGVRNDAWEKTHPMQVEVDKGADRGHYLTPELYGAPETAAIGYMPPASGNERVVHHGQILPQRRNPAPSQEQPALALPMPHMPVPQMPAPPKAPALPHLPALAGKTAGNLK